MRYGLSAGRVQSVALRLICEREDEIRAFVPEEYWTVEADSRPTTRRALHRALWCGSADEELETGPDAEGE